VTLTREQCLALVDRLNHDPVALSLLNRPDPVCPDEATLAGLGVPYRLAGQDVPPPALAAIAVLSMIRSPLLSGEESMDLMDAWRALWAVTAGAADLACLHGLDARCEAIRRGCSAAGIKPEDAVGMMAAATGAAYAEVDRRALATAARYPGATAQEVTDLVTAMLRDITAAWGRLPRGDGAHENPPKAGHASTAIGSRTWRTVRRWLACIWPRRTCGACPPPGLDCRPLHG
jgi:hypothetical protein